MPTSARAAAAAILLLAAVATTASADQYEQQSTELLGHHRSNPQPQVGHVQRHRRQAEPTRQRRDYIQWYGASTTFQQPNFQSNFQAKYPPAYQPFPGYQVRTSLPYFVPIWGNPGRIPVFFPAKPILFNPGYPIRNPPVSKPTTENPTVTDDGKVNVTIGSRINLNEEGEPIWGIVESPSNSIGVGTGRPPSANSPPVGGPRPTRPPTPPLLHRPSNVNPSNANPSNLNDRDNQNAGQSSSSAFDRPAGGFQSRPPRTTTTTTTTTTTPAPPAAAGGASQGREEPNRCVWAIISCCNPTNTNVSTNCFERLGCPGSFWDNNPCSRENTVAAFNAAARYYAQT